MNERINNFKRELFELSGICIILFVQEEFEDVADPAGMSKYFWKASTVNES
jgi:hypothetical protein